MELVPQPLSTLLRRVDREPAQGALFDLPLKKMWQGSAQTIDMSRRFHGERAANMVGPAAGPHTQLAQNIALSYLSGSRILELKTVQILDELQIPRPCIDAQNIGFNVEWSQELKIEQSTVEYAKAALLIAALQRRGFPEQLPETAQDYLLDLSLGYDLKGIQHERITSFVHTMLDAQKVLDQLLDELPPDLSHYRDLQVPKRLISCITLSTFHGCPPDEIESITKHLIDAHDLDVIVKLNPTLLGYETVAGIVNDELGYTDVSVKEQAFAEDLQFDRGIELIGELRQYAADRGHRFGIKLTNTLVVDNTKQWMPEETMYLSGPPLHVLAMTLLDRLSDALPGMLDVPGHDGDNPGPEGGRVMVSFSAGVAKENLADTLAAGVNPATICSDLLKPGGYGRLAPMLKALTKEVRERGCTDLASYRQLRQTEALAAGHTTTAAEHVASIRGDGIGAYHLDGNTKLPREVDNHLEMFGCVACNFCITVCPNDAFFSIPTPEGVLPDGTTGRQQYLVWAELCNECGNCMTFCPEDGDPAKVKPRLFTTPEVFNGRTGQGFLLGEHGTEDDGAPEGDRTGVLARDGDEEAGRLVAELLGTEAGNPLGETTR